MTSLRTIPLLVLMTLLGATFLVPDTASAQARRMGWGDSTYGHEGIAFDCNDPPAEATLVVSFVSPVSDIIGVEAKVDMCTLPSDLPPWWRFDIPGSCREGLVEVSTDFSAGPTSFTRAWPGSTNSTLNVIYGYTWSTAMNRFSILITNPSFVSTPLEIGREYYAFKLRFITPQGPCEGCAIPACFVLNSLVLTHSGGAVETSPDYVWGMWQGDNDCPFVVGSTPSTWGRLKAVYRSSP